jgi:DNA-binding MurR/RpiR family transcriptional regulator
MFDLEKVKKLNELEMVVYNYLLKNLEFSHTLTIRELSDKSHVSTSTILRMCNKLGFDGYSELKYAIKQEVHKKKHTKEQFYDPTVQIDGFIKKINEEDYRLILEPAIQLITKARQIIFAGMGTSGFLGGYGSRYFLNLGLNAYSMTDPFAPVPQVEMNDALVVALSVSGETNEVIEQVQAFKEKGVRILSITNDEHSTLAHLSDYNISYYMPERRSGTQKAVNLTTQVPVVTIIELLAHHSSEQLFSEKTSL